MRIERLSAFEDAAVIPADLVIVGGGPVGLTIAEQCAAPGRRVLVVESGLELASEPHEALNRVERTGEPLTPAQLDRRREFHGAQTQFWSEEAQPYGVRCRALGGSSLAWAGKSAPYDAMDFRHRSWVPHSGWPVGRSVVEPYILRAMDCLNLSVAQPPLRFEEAGLHSFYWQFARSRVNRLDVMRFGAEFMARKPAHTNVLLDATVTRVGLSADGARFSHLEVASLGGRRARIEAPLCVMAASGIENARLLLASRDVHAGGVGNGNDTVGRYLMDHAGARLAVVPADSMAEHARLFGFYGIYGKGRAHMFMHGLALTPEVQEREGLLNAALYFAHQRAPDDPWIALKRILRGRSGNVAADLLSVVKGSGLLIEGLGVRILADHHTPAFLREFIVNSAIRLFPNIVADEFLSRGLPHKLTGLAIEAICEQPPDRDSRITLGEATDRFGMPLARVDWRISDAERRTLLRMAQLSREALTGAGLPEPRFEDWVEARRPQDIAIIDMAHTLGTTRMSTDPKTGVVDADCRVHGLPNLYIAGGSVFPTSGHANPTLMILAFAIRLADHLTARLERG